MSMRVWLS